MRARAGFASIMLAVVVAGCTSRNSPENVADVRKTLDSSLALHAEHFKQANVAGLAEGYGTRSAIAATVRCSGCATRSVSGESNGRCAIA